jgi:hypothetical protein
LDEEALTDLELEARVRQVEGALRGLPEGSCLYPGLVQIENGWRNPKEQRPGAVQRGHIRELETLIDTRIFQPSTDARLPSFAHPPGLQLP